MSRQYESYRPYALPKSRTRVGTEEAKMMRSSIRSAMDSTVIAQDFVAVLGKAYYPPSAIAASEAPPQNSTPQTDKLKRRQLLDKMAGKNKL